VATTDVAAARRAIIHYSRDVGNKTLTFGPPLALPTVTALSTPWIVHATGTVGPDYLQRVSVYYRETIADPRAMTIVATRGWLGAGTAYDVPVPDLAGVTGFTAFWNFRRGAGVKWTVTGGEGDPGSTFEVFCMLLGICPVKPVDGATYLSAQATGTFTIP